jgi:VWFA-related protein
MNQSNNPHTLPLAEVDLLITCQKGRDRKLYCFWGLAASFLVTFSAFITTHAQSSPEERPGLKNFGSSLNKLKWDDKKKVAVEKDRRKPSTPTDEDVVRIETTLVVCEVQVRDTGGNLVTSLTNDDFIVTEDSDLQEIQHFSLGDDLSVGRTIVLLIDYSDSMSPYIKTSVEAAKMLVNQLGPKDLMAIVTDDVKLLVDFTRDKEKLLAGLNHLRWRAKWGQVGLSKQFSALMATVREMFNNEDMRRIIIFQTDGDESDILKEGPMDRAETVAMEQRAVWRARWPIRKFSLDDVYKAEEKSRASVYTVIPTKPRRGDNTWRILQPTELGMLERSWYKAAAGAAIGGWTAFLRRPEEATDIYSAILADIKSRYVIGYYPTNKTRDGKRRRVSIEIKGHPEYSVAGRKSYIASEENN